MLQGVVWWNIDLALRFLYVVGAPLLLVPLASLFPLTGVLVGVGIATIVALAGSDRWRASTSKIPVLGKPLANMANLGDYYREHHPKPLIYYVLYPALFPYWLVVKSARREFLLYRKLNAIAVLVIIGLGALDYFRNWYPEIPFRLFATNAFTTFLFQLFVTMCLVMPIVTTIVLYHQRGYRKLLYLMIAGAAGFAFFLGAFAMKAPRPSPSIAKRTEWRTRNDPKKSVLVMKAALDAAFAAPDDATAISVARKELRALWRPDEVRLFRLFRSKDKPGVIVLYAKLGARAPVWMARYPTGQYSVKRADLPPDAHKRLRGRR